MTLGEYKCFFTQRGDITPSGYNGDSWDNGDRLECGGGKLGAAAGCLCGKT
jgi:hypothetical protein